MLPTSMAESQILTGITSLPSGDGERWFLGATSPPGSKKEGERTRARTKDGDATSQRAEEMAESAKRHTGDIYRARPFRDPVISTSFPLVLQSPHESKAYLGQRPFLQRFTLITLPGCRGYETWIAIKWLVRDRQNHIASIVQLLLTVKSSEVENVKGLKPSHGTRF
jgi:hypothetical protein